MRKSMISLSSASCCRGSKTPDSCRAGRAGRGGDGPATDSCNAKKICRAVFCSGGCESGGAFLPATIGGDEAKARKLDKHHGPTCGQRCGANDGGIEGGSCTDTRHRQRHPKSGMPFPEGTWA